MWVCRITKPWAALGETLLTAITPICSNAMAKNAGLQMLRVGPFVPLLCLISANEARHVFRNGFQGDPIRSNVFRKERDTVYESMPCAFANTRHRKKELHVL